MRMDEMSDEELERMACSMSVGLMIISKLFEVVWLPYISAIVIVISVVLLNIWMCLSKNIRNYK